LFVLVRIDDCSGRRGFDYVLRRVIDARFYEGGVSVLTFLTLAAVFAFGWVDARKRLSERHIVGGGGEHDFLFRLRFQRRFYLYLAVQAERKRSFHAPPELVSFVGEAAQNRLHPVVYFAYTFACAEHTGFREKKHVTSVDVMSAFFASVGNAFACESPEIGVHVANRHAEFVRFAYADFIRKVARVLVLGVLPDEAKPDVRRKDIVVARDLVQEVRAFETAAEQDAGVWHTVTWHDACLPLTMHEDY